jgi:hypothetical protein
MPSAFDVDLSCQIFNLLRIELRSRAVFARAGLLAAAVLFSLCNFAATGSAAEESHKNEIALLIGDAVNNGLTTRNPGGSGTIPVDTGAGFTFEANYARRILGKNSARIFLEFPFLSTPSKDVTTTAAGVPRNYAYLSITPAVRAEFAPNKTLSPWVTLGGGYALFQSSTSLTDGTPNPGNRFVNRGALEFGGGVDVRTPLKIVFPVLVRAEVRDLYTGRPSLNVPLNGGGHNVFFSGGLVVRF